MTEICRTCLNESRNIDYVNVWSKLIENKTLLDCITEISSVQVLDEDPLPQSVCNQCYVKLQELYIFQSKIVTSDKYLKDKFCNTLKTSRKNTLKDRKLNNINIVYKNDNSEDNSILTNDGNESLKCEDNTKSDVENDLLSDKSNTYYSSINNNSSKHKKRLRTGKINLSNKISTTGKTRKVRVKNFKEQKIFECRECQKVFKKADHLNVHISYKHLEKQFKCEVCGKKFARKYDLTYHSRVHTGEKPFTCEMCGKSFASSSYFYMHKRIHTGIKKIKCEFCQNSFNSSDQLQIHIRQKHTGERPFLCEMCSHAFTSSSALFRHKRDVHDEKIECPICKKLYSSRVLKDHIKRHKEREEGIKRFSCNLCGKRFTCATSRKRHLVIHSGEKAFKCEVCEKSFNQRSTLQTHMRIHSQIMPFHCEICNKSFRYKHHLKIHCEKHHKNEGCNEDDMQNCENILIQIE